MIRELLPCPFCGGSANLEELGDHHGDYHNLGCSDEKCIAHHLIYTEFEHTADESVATWNRRAK